MKLSIIDKFRLWRATQDKTMIDKLKSRKVWATVIGVALTALGGQIGLSEDLTTKIVALIGTYLLSQGAVDAATAIKK